MALSIGEGLVESSRMTRGICKRWETGQGSPNVKGYTQGI